MSPPTSRLESPKPTGWQTATPDDLRYAIMSWGARQRLVLPDRPKSHIVGIGRDIANVGLSADEAELLCLNDIYRVRRLLYLLDPWIEWLDPPRLMAVTDVVWVMGLRVWARHASVRRFLAQGRFDDAAERMLQSLFVRKHSIRMNRAAQVILTGEWPWVMNALLKATSSPPPESSPARQDS